MTAPRRPGGVTDESLYRLVEPFWLSRTMYRESVVFIGSDAAPSAARLLFPPDEILAVTDAAGDAVFVHGGDYLIERQQRRIVRTAGSRMPHVAADAMIAGNDMVRYGRIVEVTYTHAADPWCPAVRGSAGRLLPRVLARLERREPLTVCVTGDSISEGYDSSGFHALPPYQPPFASLFAAGLRHRYGGEIHLHNFATAGWTAADGLWDTGRTAAAAPHLVIVAFGMNDASYADVDEFAANVSGILERIRGDVPSAEFSIVSPMLPTPECTWLDQARFRDYRAALERLAGDGIAFADVTTLWTHVIERKHPRDLSGNGSNHPNDFGHRLYAQALLALF